MGRLSYMRRADDPNLELVILGNSRLNFLPLDRLQLQGRAQRAVKHNCEVCTVQRQWYFSSLPQVRLIVYDEKITSQTLASL